MKQPPTVRGDAFYLTGFICLGTERSFPGNGLGPIPWTKAWDFAERHGFGRSMCNYFARVILLLDGHYREHLRAEQDKEAQREARRARREAKKDEAAPGSGITRRRQAAARRQS